MIKVKLDKEKILKQCEGDEDILELLVKEFGQGVGEIVNEIEDALKVKDCERFERASHTLKSNLSYFHVTELVAAAFFLEKKGSSGELDGLEDSLIDLKSAINEFLKQLGSLA